MNDVWFAQYCFYIPWMSFHMVDDVGNCDFRFRVMMMDNIIVKLMEL